MVGHGSGAGRVAAPMSEPRNITLERVNRLAQTVADLGESHAAQGRVTARLLAMIGEQLASIDAKLGSMDTKPTTVSKDIRELAAEQILIGNRIEEAFTRAARANIRLDELEDDAAH